MVENKYIFFVIIDKADVKDKVSKVFLCGLDLPPQSLHLATGKRKSRPHSSASLASFIISSVLAFHFFMIVIVEPELALV